MYFRYRIKVPINVAVQWNLLLTTIGFKKKKVLFSVNNKLLNINCMLNKNAQHRYKYVPNIVINVYYISTYRLAIGKSSIYLLEIFWIKGYQWKKQSSIKQSISLNLYAEYYFIFCYTSNDIIYNYI